MTVTPKLSITPRIPPRRCGRSSSWRARRAPAPTAPGARSFVSSSFVCDRPRRLCTNSITVGIPARETSAASCSGPLGRRWRRPRDLADGLLRELDQRLVEQDRLDRSRSAPTRPRRSPRRRTAATPRAPASSIAASFAASSARWSSRHSAVSTTEVTIPGFVTTAPIVHTAPPPAPRAISRISSSSFARAAASASRRWSIGVEPGVRRLTAERDLVALDAERAEHDAEREAHRLEHRPLLDVQLEVGRGVRRAAPAPSSARSSDDPVRGEHIRQRVAVRVAPRSQLVLVGHRARPPRSTRTASARTARPSSSAQLTSRTVDRRLALLARAGAAPRRRRRR